MDGSLAIFGATGYSGRLLARRAAEAGLSPVLCGRNAAKLEALAAELGLEHRAVPSPTPEALDAAFRGAAVVLNAAGPFTRTAEPVADACLRNGAHYLDITAESRVVDALAARSAEARARGIMIMPAVGFDVVPSDCLAAHLARRLPGATRLAIALTNLFFLTRGSARTLIEGVDFGIVRRGGVLVRVPLGSLEQWFDFGDGLAPALNVSLADVVTAYYTTAIPEIVTYVQATPLMRSILTTCRTFGWLLASAPSQAWLTAATELLPEDPGAGRDAADCAMTIVGEAHDGDGRCVRARLRTPEAYGFTAVTASAIARRVLAGDTEPGFQTPARVYGSDFVLSFPDVTREDLR